MRRTPTTGLAPTLSRCNVCGKSHRPGSQRERECQAVRARRVPAHATADASPGQAVISFDLGELARLGEGERFRDEPLPHPVFSGQVLPRDVPSAPVMPQDRLPTSSEKSRAHVEHLSRAAKSAVAAWRRRGIEPTQRMMFDLDVHSNEVEPLLAMHLRHLEDRGDVVTAALEERARRLCYHAIRTVKGLAISPTNLLRLMVRVLPPQDAGGAMSYRTVTSFAVALRSLAYKRPEVRAFLDKDQDSVTSADFAPMMAMVRNVAAHERGALDRSLGGPLDAMVTTSTLEGLSDAAVLAAESALQDMVEYNGGVDAFGEPLSLSIYDQHADLLALPHHVARDLAASRLTFKQWRECGWEALDEGDIVVLEPQLVAMRAQGFPDSHLLMLRPELANPDDAEYRYSPTRLASSTDRFAFEGGSPRAYESGSFVPTDRLMSELAKRAAGRNPYLARNLGVTLGDG